MALVRACLPESPTQSSFEKYAADAAPVTQAKGCRVLAAGLPNFNYESGLSQNVAIIEFHSLQAADAAYRSPEYQASVKCLVGTAEHDVRIIEGRT